MPDDRLVAGIRAGDERAFELVYDRYHKPLLAFCRHMLGTREEAEDALQHVFVSAHSHLVADDRVLELRPWLYAIARNRCLSVLRARRESVALDDVAEPVGAGLAVAAEVEQRQDLQDVLQDLARLPDDQRAALVLSELGALPHDEVAGVLDVRKDKVKALVFQARETLAGFRQARDADCTEIREQLANLRGGALRRAPLRRHLEVCDGCRGFRSEVRRQREAMVLLLPVVPTVALKAKVVGAVAAAGGQAAIPAAGVGAGAVAASQLAGGSVAAVGGSLAAKALIVAAIAGTAGGGYAISRDEPQVRRAAPVGGAPASVSPLQGGGPAASAPSAPTPLPSARPSDRSPGSKAGSGDTKKSGGAKGRPPVPGANGKGHAKKGRGLLQRSNGVASKGSKSRGRGSTKAASPNARGVARPAKPAITKKDPAPAAKPAGPSDAARERPTSPGKSATAPATGRPATPPTISTVPGQSASKAARKAILGD